MPKIDSRRIITFSNTEDFISFRHHTYGKDEYGEIKLKEIGPRFEMRRKFLLYEMKSFMGVKLYHFCELLQVFMGRYTREIFIKFSTGVLILWYLS